mmetsp:Transcript_4144/g.7951  ORF Transcript_4144/g.7951 Transcript_4144/m.7951 type:complete len:218 (+) Transcript_4144:505-1158(+)
MRRRVTPPQRDHTLQHGPRAGRGRRRRPTGRPILEVERSHDESRPAPVRRRRQLRSERHTRRRRKRRAIRRGRQSRSRRRVRRARRFDHVRRRRHGHRARRVRFRRRVAPVRRVRQPRSERHVHPARRPVHRLAHDVSDGGGGADVPSHRQGGSVGAEGDDLLRSQRERRARFEFAHVGLRGGSGARVRVGRGDDSDGGVRSGDEREVGYGNGGGGG